MRSFSFCPPWQTNGGDKRQMVIRAAISSGIIDLCLMEPSTYGQTSSDQQSRTTENQSLPGTGPSLTIYNDNFAVVRELIPLRLNAGINELSYSGMTALAETDSVILRDPNDNVHLQILEQSYRGNPVSQDFLLHLNEGNTIEFFKD